MGTNLKLRMCTHPLMDLWQYDAGPNRLPIIGIRIVDNAKRAGPHFWKVLGHILEIRPIQHDELEDGVYVTAHCAVDELSATWYGWLDEVTYYKPGDPEIRTVVGLWPTYEEAELG